MIATLLTALVAASVSSAAPAADNASAKDGKIVCKANKETRSRITSARICKTVAEWEQDARDEQRMLRDARSRRR